MGRQKKYNLIFHNFNMRSKILAVLLPALLVFIISTLALYFFLINALQKQLMDNSNQTLMMIRNDILSSLTSMQNSVMDVIKTTEVQDYFFTYSSSAQRTSVRTTITRLLNNEMNRSIPHARGAYLIRNQDEYIAVERDQNMSEQDTANFAKAIYMEYETIFTPIYRLPTLESYRQSGTLHYIQPVPMLKMIMGQQPALIVINVSPTMISNIFQKYYRDSGGDSGVYYSVTDYSGSLVCSLPDGIAIVSGEHPPETGYYTQSKPDGQRLIMNIRMDTIGWVASLSIPMDSIMRPASSYHILLFILLGASLVLFLLLFRLAVSGIQQRLREIIDTMRDIRDGNLDARFPVRYRDEISTIGGEINLMLENIQHMRVDIAELNLKQREAELKALQSQINPHFLYNTLESIRMVAVEQGNTEVSEQILTLSKTFRYTITPEGLHTLVYVRQEMAHVYDYLSIQNFRFSERFDVRIDVDNDILDYRTLKLILQPIIENAFAHGVRAMRKGGVITMTGRRDGDIIRFTIRDNGSGMERDTLDKLRARLMSSQYGTGEYASIGLINVSDRIRLAFGEQYGLGVDSAPGRGTTVTLTLPVMTDDSLPAADNDAHMEEPHA